MNTSVTIRDYAMIRFAEGASVSKVFVEIETKYGICRLNYLCYLKRQFNLAVAHARRAAQQEEPVE